MNAPHHALQLSDRIADLLADPSRVPVSWTSQPQWRQSLAHGLPGIALLHIERAAVGRAPWERAHAWLTAAVGAVTRGPSCYLYYGAPALAHALASAAEVHPHSYRQALAELDQAVAADAIHRCDAAHARINRGELTALAEFDTIRGLTGLGAHLLRRDPDGQALWAVLRYLVRLTDEVRHDGQLLPGWWTATAPSGKPDAGFPFGHANNGLAHGIAGPLALLSLAMSRGIAVHGQVDAIEVILAWLDRWQDGPAWPYWTTPVHLDQPHRKPLPGQRPSWCYGTAGVARAQQLAALALGDGRRRQTAESALATALSDPVAFATTTDLSACHGYAGLAHIAYRAAGDADIHIAARLRSTAAQLLDSACPPGTDPDEQARCLLATAGPAFLEGAAGIALGLLAPATGSPPASGWDTCLLIACPGLTNFGER